MLESVLKYARLRPLMGEGGIAVAEHGKTTTTAMVSLVLQRPGSTDVLDRRRYGAGQS